MDQRLIGPFVPDEDAGLSWHASNAISKRVFQYVGVDILSGEDE